MFRNRTFALFAFGALTFACSGDENGETCIGRENQVGCAPLLGTETRDNVIKIGLVAPLSGSASGAGEQLKNAAELAFSQIGWSIGDFTIELVPIDSESAILDSDAIKAKYETAMQQNDLVAGLLNWHSSVALTLMDAAADARMAHLFPLGAADSINAKFASDPQRYSVWTAKGWPEPGRYVSSYLDLMECLLTPSCQQAQGQKEWRPAQKRIFIATEPGLWGDSFEAGATSQIEASGSYWATNGWQVSGSLEVSAEDDATALANKAQQIAASGASVLLSTSTADNMGQFIEQIRLAIEPDPLIIMEGLGWTDQSLNSAGRSAAGVLDGGYSPYNGAPPVQERVREFQVGYELEFGNPPSTSSGGIAYDYTRFAILVLQRTLEKHGTIDRAGVLDVYSTEVATGQLTLDSGVVMSRYAYSNATVPDPQYGIGNYYFPVYQYQDVGGDGDISFATVFPAELRDSEVIVP